MTTKNTLGAGCFAMNRIDRFDELANNGIVVVDGFLTSDECNTMLMRIDASRWSRSTVGSLDADGVVYSSVHPQRTSRTQGQSDFSDSFRLLLSQVERRLVDKLHLDVSRLEMWQLTQYRYLEGFEAHHDCGLWRERPDGEREKTILVYLMAPVNGGETYFRALNLFVRPVQGRLVIWDNLLPTGRCNHAMIHSGEPVTCGIKIALHTWMHQFPVSEVPENP